MNGAGIGGGAVFSASRSLDQAERADVAAMADAALTADGVSPLDDQVRSELAYGAGTRSRHFLARADGRVVGYAHLTTDDEGAAGHLLVAPADRRHGVGGALLDHLLDHLPASSEPRTRDSTLRLWAHGDTTGAQELAASRGFTKVRDLWQMSRNLQDPLLAATYPDDVVVRTFEPGKDDVSWLKVNAAAFATHPEQGRLTIDDLHHRIGEPWFDARGFFLAERDGRLLGSHWTKVHSAEETGSDAIGEVYAVGIHPDAQGLGLGKALTLTGLHHLRDAGLSTVMLYVDGDNSAAVKLYERLGFATTTVDVMYSRRRP